MTDILEQLKEESLRLARGSFDSVDYGLAANIADAAIDEIERLRDTLASAQRIIERDYPNGQLAIDIRNALSGTQPQAVPVTDKMVKAGAAAMCCQAQTLGCAAQQGSEFSTCMLSTFMLDARSCLDAALALPRPLLLRDEGDKA